MSISFHCLDFDTITEVAPAAAVAVTTSRHYCMGASLHGKSRWAGSDLSAILRKGIGGWDPGMPGESLGAREEGVQAGSPWGPRDWRLAVLWDEGSDAGSPPGGGIAG